MIKTTSIILIAAILAGCAITGANYRPIIDSKNGVPSAELEQDMRECQALATQVSSGAERAAAGAIAGAVVGALFAAALGAKHYRPQIMQGAALTGALEGASAGETDQKKIIQRCLAGRGHKVVG